MENPPAAHANYMMYKGGLQTKPPLLWHHAGNQDNQHHAKADDQTLCKASLRQQRRSNWEEFKAAKTAHTTKYISNCNVNYYLSVDM